MGHKGLGETGRLMIGSAAMRTVCAWCGTTITEGEGEEAQVSHGICPRCAQRFFTVGTRYAVVPPERSFLYPRIQSAFRAVRGIQVILDRRRGDRRRQGDRVRHDRRRPSRERRQVPCLIVGAVPAVAGLALSAGRLIDPHPPPFPPGQQTNVAPRRSTPAPAIPSPPA